MADLEGTKVEGDIEISGIIINKDLEEKLKNMSSLRKYTMDIEVDTAKGAEVTLPCEYIVGSGSLVILLDTEVLVKATSSDSQGHYYEIGTAGQTSNKIQLTSDWQLLAGDILTIYVGKPNISNGTVEDRVTTLEESQLELSAKVDDIDSQQTGIVQRLNELEENGGGGKVKKYTMNITADTAKGAEVTLPCEYIVGSDNLTVVLNTEILIKATTSDGQGNYYEVGTIGQTSNKIQLTSDWSLGVGDVLTLYVGSTTVEKDAPQNITVNTIKNKNLFNRYGVRPCYYLSYTNGTPTWDSNMCYMEEYIEVEPNTQYTMTYFGDEATILVVHEYNENKSYITHTIQNNNNKSMTITTNNNTKYVRLSCGKTRVDKIQFEKGATSTEYSEHYLFKKQKLIIQTGEEFETGREIDGRTEYGKILYVNPLPASSSVTINTQISNFDRYTYVDGYTSNSWGVKMVPEKVNDQSIRLHQEGNELRITTYTDSYTNAGYNAIIEIHYTKTQ